MAWWTGQPVYGSNPVSKFIRENFAYLKQYVDYIVNSGVTTADLAAVHASPPTLAAVVNITVNTTIGDTDVGLGGGYNISGGVVLTINGAFSAPVTQIFFGAGTVIFGVGSVPEFYPEWWGDCTTDLGVPLNAAIASIKTVGGSIILPTGTLIQLTSINLTGIANQSIKISGAASRGTYIDCRVAGGIGIDCTGSQFIELRDFTSGGSVTSPPKCGLMMARNSTHNSAGRNHMYNVTLQGVYSECTFYNYGSEEFRATDCYYINGYTNKRVVVLTRDNVLGLVSAYATISAAPESMTEISFIGCGINNYQVAGTASCLLIRGVSRLNLNEIFMINNTATYVEIDADTFNSIHLSFRNIMLDASTGQENNIGWYLFGTNTVATVIIDNVLDYGLKTAANGGLLVYGFAGSTFQGLEIRNCTSGSAHINVYNAVYSDLDIPNRVLDAIFAVSNNKIRINSADLLYTRPDLSIRNTVVYSDLGGTDPSPTTGVSTPYLVVTPGFVGQLYLDTANLMLWQSIGLTNAHWVVIGTPYLTGLASPQAVITPRFTGDEFLDTAASNWYKSCGTINTSWKIIT